MFFDLNDDAMRQVRAIARDIQNCPLALIDQADPALLQGALNEVRGADLCAINVFPSILSD